MLPFLLVADGARQVPVLAGIDEREGLIGFDLAGNRLLSFDLDDVEALISIDPAAVYYGVELALEREERVAADLAAEALPRFAPRGYKFTPLPHGLVTGFPSRTLLRHRRAIPTIETIRLSAIFAGSTIMVGIEQAEKSFACLVDLFEKRGRTFAPLEDIIKCIRSLGLFELRSALYEESEAWAPIVRAAIERGLRDRALRRHLIIEAETPKGLSLAKVSFVLALLGHDCVCLDARLMNRMFGRERAVEIERGWQRFSELGVRRYENVENTFLSGNPFYDPRDPIGKARAQWMSWESVGGAPAKHSVWLNVVRQVSEASEEERKKMWWRCGKLKERDVWLTTSRDYAEFYCVGREMPLFKCVPSGKILDLLTVGAEPSPAKLFRELEKVIPEKAPNLRRMIEEKIWQATPDLNVEPYVPMHIFAQHSSSVLESLGFDGVMVMQIHEDFQHGKPQESMLMFSPTDANCRIVV